MYTRVFIVLVLCFVVDACDLDTHYENKGQCCKMCGPGYRMKHNTDCMDPTCQECGDLEYQDGYTKENKCKRQPTCDINLNFQKQSNPSKMKLSPCQCIPDHHCASKNCDTCVRNTVCQAGQRVSRNGSQTSDTECEDCSTGTFSSTKSSFTCQHHTECSLGFIEHQPGNSSSDRICVPTGRNVSKIVIPIVAVLFVMLVIPGFYLYRKARTGSQSITQRQPKNGFVNNFPQDTNCVDMETEPTLQSDNQPEEDNEPDSKPDASLKPGVSENGQPVIQDNSKSLLISQPENEPTEFSAHL